MTGLVEETRQGLKKHRPLQPVLITVPSTALLQMCNVHSHTGRLHAVRPLQIWSSVSYESTFVPRRVIP